MNTHSLTPGHRRVSAVIIGAGQAGLAMSHCLCANGIDHVVLERGEVANSWRRERWDSLRLLTPNWQSRLPGFGYSGSDPDGYMSMPEVVDFVSGYARTLDAPIHTHTTVTRVSPVEGGYRVATDRGEWQCRALVLATGAFNRPVVPKVADAIPQVGSVKVRSITSHAYRNPGQLGKGGVLVVGAAATGLQIADELQRSGRQVILAAGEHVRMPRTYRDRDILYWMHATGMLDECHDQVEDLRRARRLPSAQLIGTPARETLDFNTLVSRGVQVVGRLAGVDGNRLQFSGSLANAVKLADLKQGRLLQRIDDFIEERGLAGEVGAADRPEPTRLPDPPRLDLDLRSGEIDTVLWATGYRPDYSWLDLPVLDAKGQLQHSGGVVTNAPGLYVMGLPFLRRRKSSFLFGTEDDARDISEHLVAHLGCARTGLCSALA
ncbi:NADPH-dependent L-lysine N(6)-monooxygenase [Parahaliea maris]|uniref:NADPH-dependent L-lysine N(6)-monooxygenase n=1 Tax=Parahaliea maris TaxID=2716870 RepID=A0A5C9A8R1_9GAMM|nr:FAD-dependent oxidoreductase [Parahaliea maris]TXS95957.1 NADPH-dependent L-lysine N(6)-monooxygenase [Parahaliea maris]